MSSVDAVTGMGQGLLGKAVNCVRSFPLPRMKSSKVERWFNSFLNFKWENRDPTGSNQATIQ